MSMSLITARVSTGFPTSLCSRVELGAMKLSNTLGKVPYAELRIRGHASDATLVLTLKESRARVIFLMALGLSWTLKATWSSGTLCTAEDVLHSCKTLTGLRKGRCFDGVGIIRLPSIYAALEQ